MKDTEEPLLRLYKIEAGTISFLAIEVLNYFPARQFYLEHMKEKEFIFLPFSHIELENFILSL